MKCPYCKTHDLTSCKVNDTQVHTCETCRGLWLTRTELEEIKDKIPNDAWFDLDVWDDKEKLKAQRTHEICPVCNVPLHSLDWDDSRIVITLCAKCNGIWLDRGQFEKVIDYIKQEANLDILDKYGATLKTKIQELFTGPKHLKDELFDVWIFLNMFQYKLVGKYPNLTAALEVVNEIGVEMPAL